MPELSRYLYLAGAVPFLVLGAAHVIATPRAPRDARGLSPSDPALAESMTRSGLRMTRRTDMWRAWVGFNLSHSLGVIAFGGFVVLTGRSAAVFDPQAQACVPLAFLVATGYLWLALRYWFRTPIMGCAIAVALFLASWIALVVGGP